MRRALLALLALAVPLSTAFAETDPAPPPEPVPTPAWTPDSPPPKSWRLMFSDLSIFRWNPLGLETRARFGLQKRLYYAESAATRNNFAFFGLYPKLNPASAQMGVGGEIQPLSILNVKAYGEVQKFFGTFGFLQSFGGANSNYSDHNLDALAENAATDPQAATLLHLGIAPMLQMKFANKIALRSLLQLDYWSFDVRDGENLVYEPTFDTLLPDQGWTLSTDTDLLYVGVPNLAVGLRHTWVHPFYRERHFATQAAYDAYDNENAHHRLGFFGAYTLRDEGPGTFNKPTLILILSWYLSHKYRAGEPGVIDPGHTPDDYVSRAVPYVILGFAFESDLLNPLTMGR